MAHDDYAVIAGICRYPGLGDLDGPENDARAFHKWVTTVGGVPKPQAALAVSSRYRPAAKKAIDAKPTSDLIEREFRRLVDLAEANSKAGKGLRVGRRLYIFFAGHGFSPRSEEPALLAADATKTVVNHVPGRPYANWFLKAGYFDEVVLFMDCCRDAYPQAPLRVPPFIDLTDPTSVDRSKLLFGFATKWSRRSREKSFGKKIHGVFSRALVQGLSGDAADGHDVITASSLADYLYNNMKHLLTKAELDDPDIPKEPDLVYDNNPNARMVIAEVAAPLMEVRIVLRKSQVGRQLEILDGSFQEAYRGKPKKPTLTVRLRKGMYLAQLDDGTRKPFEVLGGARRDVRL